MHWEVHDETQEGVEQEEEHWDEHEEAHEEADGDSNQSSLVILFLGSYFSPVLGKWWEYAWLCMKECRSVDRGKDTMVRLEQQREEWDRTTGRISNVLSAT